MRSKWNSLTDKLSRIIPFLTFFLAIYFNVYLVLIYSNLPIGYGDNHRQFYFINRTIHYNLRLGTDYPPGYHLLVICLHRISNLSLIRTFNITPGLIISIYIFSVFALTNLMTGNRKFAAFLRFLSFFPLESD